MKFTWLVIVQINKALIWYISAENYCFIFKRAKNLYLVYVMCFFFYNESNPNNDKD